MANKRIDKIGQVLMTDRHIAPLAVLRIAFGAIMLISTIRFIARGWVYDFYIAPKFHFPLYGFGWLRPLPAMGMYGVFGLMALAALFVAAGLFYRVSLSLFFCCFLYTELLDKTYYLNHYYFVSIIAFLLLWVPAHRYFSLDTLRRPSLQRTHVPAWTIGIFQAQCCLVYFFAGLSKLTPDWLLEAMPLKIWLPANGNLPLIGPLLTQTWVAYAFSWFGALFDLSIGFFLLYRPTRKIAYVFVILFHVLTGLLFKIGMFPYIMIAVTLVFLTPKKRHRRFGGTPIIRPSGEIPVFSRRSTARPQAWPTYRFTFLFLALYFTLQILLPFRFILYPGTLFWTEEGYRFSWRVMLMEKSGTGFFYVTDPATGRRGEVNNAKFLTPLQERMMATQPDMILQYAHYLSSIYKRQGVKDPIITVEDYVTLNGSGSRLYIDSTVNLARQQETLLPTSWILPFNKNHRTPSSSQP
jgi:Vitamin K-dependent gamma-carboxylase